jgi:hypothetical protein
MKFELRENQYIPYKAKRLPSGIPACETYYYLVDEKGRTIDKINLKPYRGKQMERYAMKSKTEAKAYLEVVNRNFDLIKEIELSRVKSYIVIAKSKYPNSTADEIIGIINNGNDNLKFNSKEEEKLFKKLWTKKQKK